MTSCALRPGPEQKPLRRAVYGRPFSLVQPSLASEEGEMPSRLGASPLLHSITALLRSAVLVGLPQPPIPLGRRQSILSAPIVWRWRDSARRVHGPPSGFLLKRPNLPGARVSVPRSADCPPPG